MIFKANSATMTMTGLLTISYTDDMMIPDLTIYPIDDSVFKITLV